MTKIVKGFKPSGGKHCITNALKQIFEYNDYPITEEMIFGIGSGLSFTYINLASSPMVSGRIKPLELEEKIADRLDINIKCRSSANYSNAFKKTIKMLDVDTPVLVYVDMPYFEYLNLNENSHFGGHAVVIFGYDEINKQFYISDRDNCDYPIRTPKGDIAKDYHLVDYEAVEKARSSKYRPFPANNKYLEMDFTGCKSISSDIITTAINETCESMLNPPAKLLGLNGINKFAKEILKWSKFNDDKLKIAGITNYFMINADGGTGGGIFRRMYGDFLLQASKIIKSEAMKNLGDSYIEVARQWDDVGDMLWELGQTTSRELLKVMSKKISIIHKQETDILCQLQALIKL